MRRYLLEVDDGATAELNKKTFAMNGKPAFGLSVLANDISLEVLPTDKPITQEDLSRAREKGQHEAWELAQKIANPSAAGGFTVEEMDSIFGTRYVAPILRNNPFEEAIKKVKAWEESKEIHIGDVVKIVWGGQPHRAVVTQITGDLLSILFDTGNVDDVSKTRCTKTGKAMDFNILLNLIKGGD